MNGGLEFRFLGVPVKVLWMFFFITFLIGSTFRDPALIAIWMAVVFVSLMAHEMGHALAYRSCGVQPSIVLHGFGGLTFGRSLPTKQELFVTLAGPGTGLLLGIPFWWIERNVRMTDPYVDTIVGFMVFINIFWSLVNLAPLLPLDGGNALNYILSLAFKRDMTGPTRVVSLVTAGVALIWALSIGSIFIAMFAAWFGFMNFQGLSQHGAKPGPKAWSPTITNAPGRGAPGPAPTNWPPPTPAPPPPPGQGPAAGPPPEHAPSGAWSMPSAPPTAPPPAPASTPPAPDRRPRVGANARTFEQEVEVAARALSDDEPALAVIATDRAQTLAQTEDQRAVVRQLYTEIQRRGTA